MSQAGKTANQKWLAAALKLTWFRMNNGRLPSSSRVQAIADCMNLFSAMEKFGHMAVGGTYGNEQGAPDPHSTLWLAALATVLRESRLQAIPDLTESAVNFFGDHAALIEFFWTPAGCRMPCARAKAPSAMALKPNWTEDSWWRSKLGGVSAVALLKPQDKEVIALTGAAQEGLEVDIVTRANKRLVKLVLPINKWTNADGGFTAAFTTQTPLNDPCAWLTVDASGEITASGRQLGEFTPPEGVPEVIGAP